MSVPAPDEAGTAPVEWRRRQEEQALAYHFLGRCFYEAPRPEWLAAFAGDRLFEAWPLSVRRRPDHGWAGVVDRVLQGLGSGAARGPDMGLQPALRRAGRDAGHALGVGLPQQDEAHLPGTPRSRCARSTSGSACRRRRSTASRTTTWVSSWPSWRRCRDLAARAAAGNDTTRLARCFEAERDFLQDHLLAWAPACLELVEKHAETGYYRGAALLALGSLAESARLCGAGTGGVMRVRARSPQRNAA